MGRFPFYYISSDGYRRAYNPMKIDLELLETAIENSMRITKAYYELGLIEVPHDYLIVDSFTDEDGYYNTIDTSLTTAGYNADKKAYIGGKLVVNGDSIYVTSLVQDGETYNLFDPFRQVWVKYYIETQDSTYYYYLKVRRSDGSIDTYLIDSLPYNSGAYLRASGNIFSNFFAYCIWYNTDSTTGLKTYLVDIHGGKSEIRTELADYYVGATSSSAYVKSSGSYPLITIYDNETDYAQWFHYLGTTGLGYSYYSKTSTNERYFTGANIIVLDFDNNIGRYYSFVIGDVYTGSYSLGGNASFVTDMVSGSTASTASGSSSSNDRFVELYDYNTIRIIHNIDVNVSSLWLSDLFSNSVSTGNSGYITRESNVIGFIHKAPWPTVAPNKYIMWDSKNVYIIDRNAWIGTTNFREPPTYTNVEWNVSGVLTDTMEFYYVSGNDVYKYTNIRIDTEPLDLYTNLFQFDEPIDMIYVATDAENANGITIDILDENNSPIVTNAPLYKYIRVSGINKFKIRFRMYPDPNTYLPPIVYSYGVAVVYA